jgi:Glycosyltransferase family 87
VWAGVSFGVAAAIKCTPLLWAPYLAWRRRWVAAVTVVVVAGAVNLIPDLTYPPNTGGSRLVEWGGRFLKPMAERKHEFGSWACGIGGNQSVPGLWQRWLVYDPVWNDNELVGQRSESAVAPETLKAATWSSMALLLAAGVACTWKSCPGSTQAMQAPTNWALEFGMVLILMVMLSPHSSKPHFCTLVLPGFCVARAAMNLPNRRLLPLLCSALIFALLPNCDLVGDWIYSWAKWHASILWCALLLFVASCRILVVRSATAIQDMQLRDAADIRKAA